MSSQTIDALTAQFYKWEKIGRGHNVYKEPVDIEPPFHPFFIHDAPNTSITDDAKKPSYLKSALDLLTSSFSPKGAVEETTEEESREAYPFLCDESLHFLSVTIPKAYSIDIKATEQLLVMLSYCRRHISFEIVANYNSIIIQLVCFESDVAQVTGQVKAYFPESVIQEKEDGIASLPTSEQYIAFSDFGLREEFMRPMKTIDHFKPDHFTGLFACLENLQEGEYSGLQILFKGTVNSWSESILRSVLDNQGDSFFLNAPEMVPLTKEKISYPLYGVVMRVFGTSKDEERAKILSSLMGNAIVKLSNCSSNRLISLSAKKSYGFEKRLADLMYRESHRLGMLLNVRELMNFVHLPAESVVSSKFARYSKNTKSAPAITEGSGLTLGINRHQGKEKKVFLPHEQRLKHCHIIGATGTGKSTLILNNVVEDIRSGRGIAVLDPHGDLIDSIIPHIPESRFDDVLLLDPSDAEYPIGFNILLAHSEIEKEILSSDLVAVFRRLSTAWGDQMNSVLGNAILAFLESKDGGTLIDLRRFLVEKSFRDAYLKNVTDSNIIYYWEKEFPLLRHNSIGPILTRLDTFLRPKLIRNMVAQKKGIDFERILDNSKILLVKLSHGMIGAENSYLLGSVIVSKIQQTVMSRQAIGKENRVPFFLYVDEFQHFVTPSMSSILSGARKYRLGLILAHQDMQQLVKYDNELASSIVSNAGTRICFRLGDSDAKRFENGLSFFDAHDLQDLGMGEAIVRIDRPDLDFSLETVVLPEQESNIAEQIWEKIVLKSREQHGTPKHLVDDVLLQSRNEVVHQKEEKLSVAVSEKPKDEKRKAPTIKTSKTVSIEKTETVERNDQTQHRYLQTLIKRMAESKGFKATIEEQTSDNKGFVDVSIERNGKKIACEISVTTSKTWEVHNIQKCLSAGYDIVVACSPEQRTLENIREEVVLKIDKSLHIRILTLTPEELFAFLNQEIVNEGFTEKRMKGYRVKIEYDNVTDEEMKRKRESVSKVVIDSLKKLKGKVDKQKD